MSCVRNEVYANIVRTSPSSNEIQHIADDPARSGFLAFLMIHGEIPLLMALWFSEGFK